MKNLIQKTSTKVGLGLTALFGAMSAGATPAGDHTAAITAAYDQAETNANTGVVGLIALVAIVCGVGLLISLFRKA